MVASVFDLFKPGVGPSSSHTMGPMTAANRFLKRLRESGRLAAVARVQCALYASLALTGKGHATDRAVLLGLMGYAPATLDPDAGDAALVALAAGAPLQLGEGGPALVFDPAADLLWEGRTRLPRHPNALRFTAFDPAGAELDACTYFSLGGGFVSDEQEMDANDRTRAAPVDELVVPHPFTSGAELLAQAQGAGLSIAELMLANERAHRSQGEIEAGLDAIFDAMETCIDRGVRTDGVLPGGLNVKRRAKRVRDELRERAERQVVDPLAAMDWVNLWALAVNEENAAGGRVVTAPTNGAAGIVPAVLRFHDRFHRGDAGTRRTFLLTAAAIGALYKRNASISGAEVGCQGEVGSACSMAAAGLAEVLGGTPEQVENAAEIGMEHNLGLTCDPVGGLVQIPCIERNGMGAVKAVTAARMALRGDGRHHVSLDKVIKTMKETGRDMSVKYKETARGGLAVNVVEC
jgi:L-serine dehydratase